MIKLKPVLMLVVLIASILSVNIISGQSYSFNPDGILAFDLSQDGQLLVTGHINRTVRIWNVSSNQVISTVAIAPEFEDETDYLHNYVLHDVVFNPNGDKIAVSVGYLIKIIDVATGQITSEIQSGYDVFDLAWKPDGSQIAAKYLGTCTCVGVWNTPNLEQVIEINLRYDSVIGLAWSPDGTELAAAAEGIIIWNSTTWQTISMIPQVEPGVGRVKWQPNGVHIAAIVGDGTIHVFERSTGQLIHVLLGDWPRNTRLDFEWSSDGTYIAVPSSDAKIRVWNAVSGVEAFTLHINVPVDEVAWTPNGDILYATGSFTSVQVAQTPISQPTATPGATNTETAIPTQDFRLPHPPAPSPSIGEGEKNAS